MTDPYNAQQGQGGYQGPPSSSQYPTQYGQQPQYGPPQQPYYPAPYGYPPSPYGYPPQPQGPRRPGLVIAASVIGYVNAGLLIIAGAVLLFGGSVAGDLEDQADTGTNYGTEFVIDGIINLIAAGLIIGGAVSFTGGKNNGRVLLSVGNGIVLALAVYWLVRFSDEKFNDADDGFIVWAVIFSALAILPLAFSFTGAINNWLREKAGY